MEVGQQTLSKCFLVVQVNWVLDIGHLVPTLPAQEFKFLGIEFWFLEPFLLFLFLSCGMA